MLSAQHLDALEPQTRQAVQSLLAQVRQRDAEIAFKQALIDKLTQEMAVLKRMKFAAGRRFRPASSTRACRRQACWRTCW